MSSSLRLTGTGGLRVFADDWRELCETVRDTAEGFAATDPSDAWLYKSEASAFCAQPEPVDRDEFGRLEAEAATLRQRWSERFRKRPS